MVQVCRGILREMYNIIIVTRLQGFGAATPNPNIYLLTPANTSEDPAVTQLSPR